LAATRLMEDLIRGSLE